MIQEAIAALCTGENLTRETAGAVMNEIMTGAATPAQIAGFLTALHIKGESVDEITACAEGMRAVATPFDYPGDRLEIVGTGGDKAGSVNISTMAAFVCAAAGCKVTKHGNRAASSKCGAADCLEALGADITVSPEVSRRLLDSTGFCFLFAQKYHTAMRYVGGVRKELKIPTVFNILGPLANPAKANLQLLGVYTQTLLEPLAHVLANLGVKRGMVVYGTDVLDEISISAPTAVCEFDESGRFERYEITPEQFGFARADKSAIAGGTPAENAAIAREILSGKACPAADAVLLNAGAALHIAKEIPISDGVALAREQIASGAALRAMEAYVAGSYAAE